MVEKKTKKKSSKTETAKKSPKATKSKASPKSKKVTKSKKPKKSKDDSLADAGIVIVEDDLTIDKEKVNEERKAYLEEARSQEAFD